MNAANVSSPAATGGAGTFFEQHVNAYWLALLLVRGIPPILHDCTVSEVCLQTEHLGWNTDDFLIVGQDGSGNFRKLAGQVKRTFTVSATDSECKKAIQDFWKDFTTSQKFSSTTDRFALVILRGTNTLLEHFAGLLDCSRAARDGAEFEARLAIPKFLSSTAIRYCGEIQAIISESEGKSVSAADIWAFLRVLHVLSLDLNSSTRQTEVTIKTLLAYMTDEQDAVSAAKASWDALLSEIGAGAPEARSYRREDLPETLRLRHSQIGTADQRILSALKDHSVPILDGIHTTIGGDLHLSRGHLVQQIIDRLEESQVVLVVGAAGSGKSAIAKDTVSILAKDNFVFTFRAEEFAFPHLDTTLLQSQIPCRAPMLAAILAGQGRKILLVESVERLLEASIRDAFTDLLTLASKDASWRLVMTCRDYSEDLVRTGLLAAAQVDHSVVTVTPLNDEELLEVERVHPTLARPLANTSLRSLLRNPYILDKAHQISWAESRSLPHSEREFRLRFWQEIVRLDHRSAEGMPRRREQAFVQVALRRARALTLYANCGDLDPEVLACLRNDSLLAFDLRSEVLVAPSHDVLEDWALLHWIDEQSLTNAGSIHVLASALGTYPAVRRAYRKWVIELVGRDLETSDRIFEDIMRESALPAQFRDDTLVSMLRSTSSPKLLERHAAELFANDKHLLHRVIHLLRVACVALPAWRETTVGQPSLFNVPDGPSWACVLLLVQTRLQSFTAEDSSLLLGFIEDWARGVSWMNPYPQGAESVAAIAHSLVPRFDNYRSKEQLDRTLKVLAKIPNADRERFAALLQERPEEEQNQTISEFLQIIFEGIEGTPLARDMPNEFMSAAKHYLLCSENDLLDEWDDGIHQEIETLFGVKHDWDNSFFPAKRPTAGYS